MVTTSGELTGASVAAARPLARPVEITRAAIIGGAGAADVTTVEAAAGDVKRLVFPDNFGPHYMNIGISRSDRTSSLSLIAGAKQNDIRNTETRIILPLPENIRDVIRIAYTESSVIGGANALQAIGGGAFAAAQAVVNAKRPPNAPATPLGAAASTVAGALGDPAYNDVIARTGLTPNQMLTVLLQGPTYKTHNFTWKLYPRNAKESKQIKNIIQELKNKSRPGTSLGKQFFTFPRLFNLSFTINGKEPFFSENDTNNYLFAFKPAVLEGISVNYTPSGQPALYKVTGAPDGVELTLSFKEVEYWLNEEVDEGFDEFFGRFGDALIDVGDAIASLVDTVRR